MLCMISLFTIASVWNRIRHFSHLFTTPTIIRPIRASVRITEFDFKQTNLKKVLICPIAQKIKLFDLLVFTFKDPNLWEFLWRSSRSAFCSLDNIQLSMQWCRSMPILVEYAESAFRVRRRTASGQTDLLSCSTKRICKHATRYCRFMKFYRHVPMLRLITPE